MWILLSNFISLFFLNSIYILQYTEFPLRNFQCWALSAYKAKIAQEHVKLQDLCYFIISFLKYLVHAAPIAVEI